MPFHQKWKKKTAPRLGCIGPSVVRDQQEYGGSGVRPASIHSADEGRRKRRDGDRVVQLVMALFKKMAV